MKNPATVYSNWEFSGKGENVAADGSCLLLRRVVLIHARPHPRCIEGECIIGSLQFTTIVITYYLRRSMESHSWIVFQIWGHFRQITCRYNWSAAGPLYAEKILSCSSWSFNTIRRYHGHRQFMLNNPSGMVYSIYKTVKWVRAICWKGSVHPTVFVAFINKEIASA